METAALKTAVLETIDSLDDQLQELSQRIHANPELGFSEVNASAWLTELLRSHGLGVDQGVAELPTAFRGAYQGRQGPTIALLAEYDALPEVGHGCGHNLICTASSMAAIALAKAWPDLPGKIVVMGTPAEEGGGGKILMIERGAFSDVDLSMMFHPGVATIVNTPSLAATTLQFRFTGKASHAAIGPWDGVNAADAAMLFFNGVNAMRQHVRPDVRLHGYIHEAGVKPNIIPAHAGIEFMVRANRAEDMHRLVNRVLDIARGAALMTGASFEYTQDRPYLDYRHSHALGAAAENNLTRLGVDTTPVTPETPRASGDAGNVSHLVPHLSLMVSISDTPIPGHSPEWRDAAGSPTGAQALRTAAKTLALTSIDVFSDPELLAQAKREQSAAVARPGQDAE